MSEKPLMKKSYGSIPHLSTSKIGKTDKRCPEGQETIATKKARDWKDLVICQEKVDGSNVAVAKISGVLAPMTRAGYLAITSQFKQHHLFNNWVFQPGNRERFEELLRDGERLCGEWMLQTHGTRYELVHEPFVAFDIMVDTDRLIYHEFLRRVSRYDFVIPNLVHLGQPIKVDRAMKTLERSGHGAIDPVEGAVWRVERDGRVDFLVKHVRTDKIDGLYMKEEIFNAGWEKYIRS